jgi:uncharacterized protein
MQPSMFNKQFALADGGDVFLMNMFTDAQLVVSRDVVDLLDRVGTSSDVATTFSDTERSALRDLSEHGFVVEDRATEWEGLNRFFQEAREDANELGLTVLTTLQCNFACDYCLQGDHDEHNAMGDKMSLQTAEQLCEWAEMKLDHLGSSRLSLRLFGGEPLLNQPVMFAIAERLRSATRRRGVDMGISLVTNGLLLTPDVVDRLEPCGLESVKITLDGDRTTHDRMRPLRGGQGTFDRIIENVRRVAPRCKVVIGGNFDEESVDSYPALLDFLAEQEFAESLVKVHFKPIIGTKPAATPAGLIPLTAVGADGKALGGACMTSAGSGGGSSTCSSCGLLDTKMEELRVETKKRGFATDDGFHMGPCEIHRQHSYTIGTDGSLHACPGFADQATSAVGHITGEIERRHRRSAADFDALAPWKSCGECAFIPVCAGGCSVASHSEAGDKHKPNCHKESMESALAAHAMEAAAGS